MSQSVVSNTIQTASPPADATNEFSYRPVPVLAPVALFFGVCSFIGLFAITALAICVAGVVLGAVCILQIRRSQGELGGKLLATAGIGLSALFLISGSSLHAYNFVTELPEGYQRVHFYRDISKKGLVREDGKLEPHGDVKALDGKNILLKGYMYPTRLTENLASFIMVKDSEKCCFGGQPELTDMVLVRFKDGMSADYLQGLVSVAGLFRLRAEPKEGVLEPIYELEGTHFGRARTSL